MNHNVEIEDMYYSHKYKRQPETTKGSSAREEGKRLNTIIDVTKQNYRVRRIIVHKNTCTKK